MVATEESKKVQLWKSISVLGHGYVSFPEDCLDVDVGADVAITRQSDGTIIVRSFSQGSIRARLVGHNKQVIRSAISKSSRWLATYANDNEVLVWDLQSYSLQQRITLVDNLDSNPPTNVQLAFSSDDRFIGVAGLSTASNQNFVRIWNVMDGTVFRELSFNPTSGSRIAFSPDSRRLAVGSEGIGAIFSIDSEGPSNEQFQSGGQIWHLQFTPDGKQLVTSGYSQGANVWDAVSLRKLSQFARSRSILKRFSISPDGQTLATAVSDNTVRLWHLPTGRSSSMEKNEEAQSVA